MTAEEVLMMTPEKLRAMVEGKPQDAYANAWMVTQQMRNDPKYRSGEIRKCAYCGRHRGEGQVECGGCGASVWEAVWRVK